MHYYQHHIGDFIRATACLNDSQTLLYLRLLWLYYDTEKPLPDEPQVLALKAGGSEGDVKLILQAFFSKDGEYWSHKRCDGEISRYRDICDRNQTNGKLGGRPRKTQSVSSGLPVGTQSEPSRNPNHIAKNQKITPIAQPDGFAEFWEAYPKKKNKGDAEKAWKKLRPSADVCIAAIEKAKATRDWQKEGGQFIPYPASWLNAKGWEDGDQMNLEGESFMEKMGWA